MENESNLRWLLCDLQLRQKTLVRCGKRKEVPIGDKWVFCPLRASPRDRVSTKICEKCKHFKGYRKIAVTQQMTESLTKDFQVTKKQGGQAKHITTITLSDKDFEDLDTKQKEWRQKEVE